MKAKFRKNKLYKFTQWFIQCLKMASIETKMEAPTTATVFTADPMTLAAVAASGVSAVAVGPAVTTAPAAFPAASAAGAAAEAVAGVAVVAAAAAEAVTKKSARRRTTAKVVTEIGWDAMVNREKGNEKQRMNVFGRC